MSAVLLVSLQIVTIITVCTEAAMTSSSSKPLYSQQIGRNSSENSAPGYGLSRKVFQECVESGFVSNSVKAHLYTFVSTGITQCWMYCVVVYRCWYISYDAFTSSCSLFDISAWIFLDDSNLNLTASKSCMDFHLDAPMGSNLSKTLSLSQSGSHGFLIRNNIVIISCLNKRHIPENNTETLKDVSYGLTWRSCNEASKWMLQKVQNVDSYYYISPMGEPDFCLDARIHSQSEEFSDRDLVQAFVTKCGRNSTQMMVIRPSLMGFDDDSIVKYDIYSLSGSQENGNFYILFTGDEVNDRESLSQVSFIDPQFYPPTKNQICSLSQFSTRRGTVKNKENLPFFLAGQKVEVQCDQGYGVESLNFTGHQVVECNTGVKPLPCSRIPQRRPRKDTEGEGGGGNGQYLIMMVAIVSSISMAVFIVVLMVKKKSGEVPESDRVSKNTLETM